ncbi:MAG: hypothetical protein HDS26_05040 [Bacteroides sp.]|nr:hypothetical protein [Bacteroides sp.]MBD5307428.1 hypothetical protein [Bacteroides sp.]
MEEKIKLIDIPLQLDHFDKNSPDLETLRSVMAARSTAEELLNEQREMDALERIVSGMRALREFSDYDNTEFRALLVALLSDLAEIHYILKDYKQSEKELEMLFKVLDPLIRLDADRFARYHILAMELSTRILRSRKKTMELLVKQQLAAEALYEKVNAGVLAATDRLVDSLRNVGQLLASTGDYRGAMKFYAEAIKISKKKSGRVNRKEIKMTIEMAEIMMRLRQMRPRARRLLAAVLPHAISLETIELEEDILALTEMMDLEEDNEPRWKMFVHKISKVAREQLKKATAKSEKAKENSGKDAEPENQPESGKESEAKSE